MPSNKPSANAELDGLRQAAAQERLRQRDLEAELEAAKAEVDVASCAITDGYAAEDQRAVTQAREAEEPATAGTLPQLPNDDLLSAPDDLGVRIRVRRDGQQVLRRAAVRAARLRLASGAKLIPSRRRPATVAPLEIKARRALIVFPPDLHKARPLRAAPRVSRRIRRRRRAHRPARFRPPSSG